MRSLPRVAILDDPLPLAAVRGTTVIVSRGLVESTSLAAALAHECAHLRSIDGRLTEALERLSIWTDPLGPSVDPRTSDRVDREGERSGLLYSTLRLLVSLAGGGQARQALCPLWSAHWRRREFAADAGAAAAGQGLDLARHLRDEVLPFEISKQRGVFNLSDHPPTALRIERLEAAGAASGTK
jgi:Zn-dependent protease with chaperone function